MIRTLSPRLLCAALCFSLAATLLLAQEDARDKADAVITNSIGMKLRRIPEGKINVTVTPEDFLIRPAADTFDIEITRPYLIGVHEVTQAEYVKVMGKNPSSFAPTGENRHRVRDLDTKRFPVENITWHLAKDFCAKLSALPEEKAAGRTYRLPTGNEWEYAARAGKSTPVLFALGENGKGLSSDLANFDGRVPHEAPTGKFLQRPSTVGSYRPNAWGLHDMHGNVWEWCSDEFRGYDRKVRAGFRMLRGGSWLNRGRDCAASTRLGLEPDDEFNNVGLRVVCEMAEKK